MENSIIPQDDGYLASSDEKSIFFPNAELLNVGCKNCIWKLHNQCPYGYVDEQAHKDGICSEMINFLVSLADKNDSLTSIWEKFYIYKARLQESSDYKDFIKLNNQIKEMENDMKSAGWSEKQLEEMDRLKSDRMAAKIWWAKLNQYVVFSMQKIVDRETKQNEIPRLAGIHSSGTINFNIKQETKQIEQKDGKI